MYSDKEIKKIIKNPINFVENNNTSTIVKFIEYANHQYYNEGNTIIPDEIYDIIYDKLKEMDPENKIFTVIGSTPTGKKVKLPYWLGSMDKIKPDSKELRIWLNKYKGDYHIGEKLDGLSMLLEYKDNKYRLYTRGRDGYGKDISHLAKHLNLPKLKDNVAVRGELIMSKSNFIKYKKIYKDNKRKFGKLRDFITSVVNSKEIDGKLKTDIDVYNDIDFVVFDILVNNMKMSDKYNIIKKLGFKYPKYRIIDELDGDYLKQTLIEFKNASDYEIDGIIITNNKKYELIKSGNPKYSVAFKMVLEGQIKKTIVEEVEWNPSKQGYLKPKIRFNEINIGGDCIRFTTGFNAKYIYTNKIGKGTILKIIKSGDVIPYILEIVKNNKKPDMPVDIKYHWNKSGVEIILDDIENNLDVRAKRLLHFFRTIKIEFLSEGLINKLINAGYTNINDILNMCIGDFEAIDGFHTKLANKIHNSIHNIISNPLDLNVLMAGSNIFGGSLGKKKLNLILEKYPKSWNKLSKSDLLEVDGISDITANIYLKNLPKFLVFLDNHKQLKYKLPSQNNIKVKSKILGMKIIMTGFRDKELEKMIIENGGEVQSSVSKITSIVIAKDINSKSSKLEKARSLNLEILSINDFKKKYF